MGFVVNRSKRFNFRLILETWTPERKQETVPREAFITLGFDPMMSYEDAKLRAKQINKQKQIESRQITTAAKRVQDQQEINSAYLPEHLVEKFESELEENYSDNSERLNNLMKQWSIVQKMISALALDPKDFYEERHKFFNYYKEKAWGPDYIKKLNHMANMWGSFCSRKTKSYFQPIPRMSGVQINKILELRENKPGIKTPSDSLAWIDLKNLKTTFEHEGLIAQWNWMYIGLWFGLRPKEIDYLKKPKNYRLENDVRNQTKVLMVYQSKLTSLAKDKRWKPIPIFLPEQKEALGLILLGNFKRPLNKTLKRFFKAKIETYSPRKGFTDLMLDHGFSLEDISVFLGHADISMTWKHYKNKMTWKIPSKVS